MDSALEITGFVKVVSRFLLAPEMRGQVGAGAVREAMNGFLQDAQVCCFRSGFLWMNDYLTIFCVQRILKTCIGGDTAFHSLTQDFLVIQNGIDGTLVT